MAKKRRRSDGNQRKRGGRSKRAAENMPPLPDRRVMEGMMRQLVGGLQGMPANPALQQAQDLIYEAVGLADESEKVRLAQQALALCPDCADAYVLLAEHAK